MSCFGSTGNDYIGVRYEHLTNFLKEFLEFNAKKIHFLIIHFYNIILLIQKLVLVEWQHLLFLTYKIDLDEMDENSHNTEDGLKQITEKQQLVNKASLLWVSSLSPSEREGSVKTLNLFSSFWIPSFFFLNYKGPQDLELTVSWYT